MRISNAIIALSGISVISSQPNIRNRDEYMLERRMDRTYPLLYKKYCKRHGSSPGYYTSASFKAFLSLRLRSDLPFIIGELEKFTFNKDNYQTIPLGLLEELEEEISQGIIKDLEFHEIVSLSQIKRKNVRDMVKKIDATDDLKSALLSSALLTIPFLDKIQSLIDRGAPLEVLEKLIPSEMVVFLENAHLSLWNRPIGDLLLEYVSLGHIKYYDSHTLNYLGEDESAQHWIMLAESEDLIPETIVSMFDFPELAEYIFKTPDSKVLKGIFENEISGWRQSVAGQMNWKKVKWSNDARKRARITPSLLPYKRDLFFDGMILEMEYSEKTFRQIFGDETSRNKLKQRYRYHRSMIERQELVYLYLKNEGYPIQDIFSAPNDELEGQIWNHFKTCTKNLNWAKFKILEMIRYKFSLSYSQAALGGEALVDEYFDTLSDNERKHLFSDLIMYLNDYFGTNVRISFKGTHPCNDALRTKGKLSKSSRGCDYLAEFKEAYLNGINVYQLYPQVVEGLKQERELISRAMLSETLGYIAAESFGHFYGQLIRVLNSSCNVFHSIEKRAQFQNWSNHVATLSGDIKRLYLSYHPQDIFKSSSFHEAMEIDEMVINNLNSEGFAYKDDSDLSSDDYIKFGSVSVSESSSGSGATS